jgi:hypothetical protein
MIARPSAIPTAVPSVPSVMTQPQRGNDWFGPRMRADLHGPLRRVPPPEHLLPVVQQLLTGATDLTASRQLGLSPRTYSRRVSELLEYLGVESRFQAGVEAARRGWLPHLSGPDSGPGSTPGSVPGSVSGNRSMPLPRLHHEVMAAERENDSRPFIQR